MSDRIKLILAFAAVYSIWGSSFLAIRYAIETLPPFTLAGCRFILAGTVLCSWAHHRGNAAPHAAQWRAAAIVGVMLLTIGNGAVCWAQQRVPSGLTALMVAMVPFWTVLFESRHRGRPPGRVIAGVVAGMVGLAILAGPGKLGGRGVDPLGAIALVFSTASWSFGSIWSRTAPLPRSSLQATGMEMLCGGVGLLTLGLISGEPSRLSWAAFTPRAVACLLYLSFAASIVAFTAYMWLLTRVSATRVSTYAYVNPVIAMFLGWAVGGEELSSRALVAAVVILGGVVMILSAGPIRAQSGVSGARDV